MVSGRFCVGWGNYVENLRERGEKRWQSEQADDRWILNGSNLYLCEKPLIIILCDQRSLSLSLSNDPAKYRLILFQLYL